MKKLSKILLIDTATSHIFLSLVIDGKEKRSVYQEGINNHSVTIIPLLNEILQTEGIELNDLDEIIVGIGPGSYTGVRIGVTVAKMIGYLNHITVKTVSSLALIASASDSEIVIPAIDARRGNAFISTFKQNNRKLVCIKEDSLSVMEEYLKNAPEGYDLISEGQPRPEKIIGSGLLHEVENIHDLIPNYLRITEAERNKNGNNH
ncbi:MAG TPA: tRNA (adenosine(37)-N6)-threonylcarbamoyltransferase complex dimerization subunit type 1 TsaB [Bacillota bacterium]|nr:tRNA (adenosine(37)-N6)-threonylcarbamoyltransferase complex dimerization subunit type 1 TsaB [Bacillota bacterium]